MPIKIHRNLKASDNYRSHINELNAKIIGYSNIIKDCIDDFYIEAINDDTTILFTDTIAGIYSYNLEYSLDYTFSWYSLDGVDEITLGAGDRLYLRCVRGEVIKYYADVHIRRFFRVLNYKRINIGGNLHKATYNHSSVKIKSYSYHNFFLSLPIVDASSLILPATTLAERCYELMFQDCSQMVAAPKLPATTLAEGCYSSMFTNCGSLITPIELPATTLVKDCYFRMFYNCVKLTEIRCHATNIAKDSFTYRWTYGVSTTGTFYKNPNAAWTRDFNGIPFGWDVVDYNGDIE